MDTPNRTLESLTDESCGHVVSPYVLKILLHYYSCGDDFYHDATGFNETMAKLVDNDLLSRPSESPVKYRITGRGRAYIMAILRLPFPVQKWVMP